MPRWPPQRAAARALACVLPFCVLPGGGCGGGSSPQVKDDPARTAVIVDVLTKSDAAFLRERPGLAAGKYALMAADAFSFFRGTLALFLNDWRDPARGLQATRFPAGDAQPFGLGDAHPENFGTMRTTAGTFRLEPNDFDTADLLPYLWDVRRFGVGMCLAARLSNPSDAAARTATASAARAVAKAAAAAYGETMRSLAAGGMRPAIEGGDGNAILDDVFMRALHDWDHRVEFDRLTTVDDFRTLVRGGINKARPEDVTRDLPARVRLEIAATLSDYRATLPAPPPTTALVPLDAVQEFGQGIGSFPRVRALALVRGATTGKGDDVILEVKELPPQNASPLPITSTFASPGERVTASLAAGWTERGADPFWGVGRWAGFPAQIRTEAEGFKTVRVGRLEGDLGMPAAVSGLGTALARLIARMHAAPLPNGQSLAAGIAAEVARDADGFANEQADVALAYCDQVLTDWALFKQALARLGPTLGVAGDPSVAATPELRVLYDPQADPRAAGVDPVINPITINEISATGAEFVELANTSGAPQDLSTCRVADADQDGGPRFNLAAALTGTLPANGKVVVAGGYMVAAPGPQTACPPAVPSCFQATWDIAASRGETIYLLSPGDVILDQTLYPAGGAPAGSSWARLPDATGVFGAAAPSPGQPNLP